MKTAALMLVILFAVMIGFSGTSNIYGEEEVTQEEQLDEERISPEGDMKDEEVLDEERESFVPDEERENDPSEDLEDEERDEGIRYLHVDDVERL